MKKLTEEFNRVSNAVRLGDADDVQIHYGVFVGDPDCENTFLDSGQFVCQDHFTTYSDAQQARELVANILAIVDAHKDEDTGKETSRDLYFNRQKILNMAENKYVAFKNLISNWVSEGNAIKDLLVYLL